MPEAAAAPKTETAHLTILVAGEEAFTLDGTVNECLDAAVSEGKRLSAEGVSSSMRVTVGDDLVAQGEFIALDSASDTTVQ